MLYPSDPYYKIGLLWLIFKSWQGNRVWICSNVLAHVNLEIFDSIVHNSVVFNSILITSCFVSRSSWGIGLELVTHSSSSRYHRVPVRWCSWSCRTSKLAAEYCSYYQFRSIIIWHRCRGGGSYGRGGCWRSWLPYRRVPNSSILGSPLIPFDSSIERANRFLWINTFLKRM